MNFDRAHEVFRTARYPDNGKPLQDKNTRLYKAASGDHYVVKYYDTEIVKIFSDGSCQVSTGSRATKTVKARIWQYAGCLVYTRRYKKYVGWYGRRYIFENNMVIFPDGTIRHEDGSTPQEVK